jgi:uncharacterized membrane protein YhaH (DUF805 family)
MLKAFTYFISCLYQHYIDFNGCASREEYWSYAFCWLLIAVLLLLLNPIIYLIWEALTLLPGISVGVRRMHDTNRSGWLLLLTLIPVIGWLILLYLLLLPSKKNYTINHEQ